MFNLGMQELILILVVALVILGPRKLPELAKSLGKGLREFRKAADDMKDSFEKDLRPDDRKPASDSTLNPADSAGSPGASSTPADQPVAKPSEPSGKAKHGQSD